jgi:hypothetical protein
MSNDHYTTKFDRIREKRGYSKCRNPLILRVAGAGFEPATFGL